MICGGGGTATIGGGGGGERMRGGGGGGGRSSKSSLPPVKMRIKSARTPLLPVETSALCCNKTRSGSTLDIFLFSAEEKYIKRVHRKCRLNFTYILKLMSSSAHPEALLAQFLSMYGSRATLAVDEFEKTKHKVAVVVQVPPGGTIVPDMPVRTMNAEQLLSVGRHSRSVQAASTLLASIADDQACMCVLFTSPSEEIGAMAAVVQIHKTVDVRA